MMVILMALEPKLSEQVRHGLGTLMVQSYDPSKLHPSGRAPLWIEGLVGPARWFELKQSQTD